MRSVCVSIPGAAQSRVLCVPAGQDAGEAAREYLLHVLCIAEGQFWLDVRGGRGGPADGDGLVSVRLRLLGGKGGFGSQLRAQGNRMSSRKRAGGYESCRDLSGRRIRTINQTNLISDYLKRKPEVERKREAEIREKMLRAIEAPDRKPVFSDVDYLRTARETVDNVELAVHEALLMYDPYGNLNEQNEDDDSETDSDDDSEEESSSSSSSSSSEDTSDSNGSVSSRDRKDAKDSSRGKEKLPLAMPRSDVNGASSSRSGRGREWPEGQGEEEGNGNGDGDGDGDGDK